MKGRIPMQIQTKYLGEVEIQDSDVIAFPNGLPGFEDYKKFTLLAIDPDLPIALLQSTEEAAISFVVAFPYAFKSDYVFDLSAEDIEELQIENIEDVLTYSIVTLQQSFTESTLNLLAPVVINNAKKIGKQVVLHDSGAYPLKFPFNAMAGSAK